MNLDDLSTEDIFAQYVQNSLRRNILINRLAKTDLPDVVKLSFIQTANSASQLDVMNEMLDSMTGTPEQTMEEKVYERINWRLIGRAIPDATPCKPHEDKSPCATDSRSYVYFIESETSELIKIGRSADPVGRFRSIKTMSPDRLVLIGYMPEGEQSESELHKQFAHIREHGEWFKDCSELREFINRQNLTHD